MGIPSVRHCFGGQKDSTVFNFGFMPSQRLWRRPADYSAFGVIAAIVTWTLENFLIFIPGHNTAQVRAAS
jgi:hypothetical protein